MKERPILMASGPVCNILSGRQTQDRRPVKIEPSLVGEIEFRELRKYPDDSYRAVFDTDDEPFSVKCPYGQPVDRLWVREAFRSTGETIAYRAGGELSPAPIEIGTGWISETECWRPSIHMPRWASRITLEITGVRVERLNEISEADAMAEGAMFHDGYGIGHSGYRHDINNGYVYPNARRSFGNLWESCYGPGSWAANPWVWVIDFRRIKP